MGKFKGGVSINHTKKQDGSHGSYLRIRAGPQRGKYVHTLVAEAKLGRPLFKSETVEHQDGVGLNCAPDNIIVVSRPENTRLMHKRRNGAGK